MHAFRTPATFPAPVPPLVVLACRTPATFPAPVPPLVVLAYRTPTTFPQPTAPLFFSFGFDRLSIWRRHQAPGIKPPAERDWPVAWQHYQHTQHSQHMCMQLPSPCPYHPGPYTSPAQGLRLVFS